MQTEAQVNAVRSALLFLADKARKAGDLLQRFDSLPSAAAARDEVRTIGSNALALAQQVQLQQPIANPTLAKAALLAYSDDLNRKVQLMQDRYNLEAATDLADKLNDIYAVLAALEVERVQAMPAAA